LLVPHPQYSSITMNNVPIGKSRYDSFQLEGKRRYANGLTFSASYTISKTLEQLQFLNTQSYNPGNPDASVLDERLATFDVPQKASILGTYELPYGHGKRFGAKLAAA
jgi:trimeric autotransporter adhesin